MSSFFALLSQQSPNLQTRKGLIVVGLQNDFILPDGKLPVRDTAFLDRIARLVPSFREHGDVVFVRSEFQQSRPVNGDNTPGDTVVAGGSLGTGPGVPGSDNMAAGSKKHQSSASFEKPDVGANDEELFLTRTSTREPCCVRGTKGAEYADRVRPLIMRTDLQVTKTHYSAFGGTSLLLTLRSKLITDVYICGCMTNLSVYATAMDAARHGIEITLIEDCLGYRRYDRHEMAIRQLSDLMDANTVKADRLIARFQSSAKGSDCGAKINGPKTEQPNLLQDQSGILEVDSDEDSEEEATLPPVGLSRRLLDRTTERSCATSPSNYSRSAAERSRIVVTEYAKSRSSQHHSWEDGQPHSRENGHTAKSQGRDERRHERVKQNFYTSSSHSRLMTIGSSARHPGQPWLDIIPPNYKPPSERDTQPTSQNLEPLTPTKAAGTSRSNLQKLEDRLDRLRQVQDMTTNLTRSRPLFGEDKGEESAGSRILYNLLPEPVAENVFEELQLEVNWQSMFHQSGQVPRLVCCQATIGEDGSMPVYRHPSDQTIPVENWSSTVNTIRKAAEKVAGHTLNHALIQLYRDGNDFISEHSDKTLDITPGSSIVNVSFGAQRTMRIRTKRGAAKGGSTEASARTTYRIPTPHNSIIIMSLRTNAEYLHAINWDRRPACELVGAEKAYGGQRISLTFRHIATFLNKDSTMIWGRGAIGKSKEAARPVVNADPMESEKLIRAFGKENAASTIDWNEIYGAGSDVLHLK